MKIQVLFFGISKDIVGSNLREVELPEQALVLDLKNQLIGNYPEFEKLRSLSIAVNNEYRNDDFAIAESDEVAIIPPVCGG